MQRYKTIWGDFNYFQFNLSVKCSALAETTTKTANELVNVNQQWPFMQYTLN